MKEVIVTGFPKSGTTWLIRLLCDLLEAEHQDTLDMKPLSYGHPVENEWMVKKRHGPYWDISVPTYWDLSDTSTLTGETVVMIQRDPRDVVVSGMFYYGNPDVKFAIDVMVSSQYVDYLNSWLKPIESLNVANLIFAKYELLHSHPIQSLRGITNELTGDWLSDARIEEALERQSFENMSRQYTDGGHFMRKGIMGDWRNHFTRETARMFNVHFGQFMLEQGYVDSLEWWKDFEKWTRRKDGPR